MKTAYTGRGVLRHGPFALQEGKGRQERGPNEQTIKTAIDYRCGIRVRTDVRAGWMWLAGIELGRRIERKRVGQRRKRKRSGSR